jgi:hypothetical protein
VKDDEVEEGSIVVWDGHFGPNEAGVSLDSLLADPGYRLLYSMKPEVPTRTLAVRDLRVRARTGSRSAAA